MRDCFLHERRYVSFICAGNRIDIHANAVHAALRRDRYRNHNRLPARSNVDQSNNAVRAPHRFRLCVHVLRRNHHNRVSHKLHDVRNHALPKPVIVCPFSELPISRCLTCSFRHGIYMPGSNHKRKIRHSQFPVDLRRVANQKCAPRAVRSVQDAMHGILILCRDLILRLLSAVSLRNRILLRRASGPAVFFCRLLRVLRLPGGFLYDLCLLLRKPVHARVGVRADLLDVRIQLRAVRQQLVDLCLFLFSRHHVVVVQQAAHHQGAEYRVRRAAGGEEIRLRRLPQSP